jgi:HAD superfamily hydrolase (TIGR01509 family)
MNAIVHPLACVIFDIDGTLTQTNDLIFASFNHVAERHLGKRFSPPEIIALFGPPEEGALRKVFGDENLEGIMEELCAYYSAHHASMASLHPGIDEVLAHLKDRGVRLAVFTGKGRRTAMITLNALRIATYFDMVVSGNDVVNHKPHPEGILKVLEAFGLEPGQVLMVGDSLTDISASRAAGVRIVSVLWDSYEPERVRQANGECVFDRVEEMLAWFRAHIN